MVKESKVITHAELLKTVVQLLEDKKAEDMVVLHVRDLTTVADDMIVVTGTSNPHLRAMMNLVVSELKKSGVAILGVEGAENGEWILVDLGSILVHLMLPQVRKYYELEKLWSVHPG